MRVRFPVARCDASRAPGEWRTTRETEHLGTLAALDRALGTSRDEAVEVRLRRSYARARAAEHRELEVGVVLAVDVDSDRERHALRARLAAHVLTASRVATSVLRSLLAEARSLDDRRRPSAADLSFLARAARGRPGWMVECASRIWRPDVWSPSGLRRHLIRTDAELALWRRRAWPARGPLGLARLDAGRSIEARAP